MVRSNDELSQTYSISKAAPSIVARLCLENRKPIYHGGYFSGPFCKLESMPCDRDYDHSADKTLK